MMPAESEFLKPISEQALRESEIVAMRTLSGHIESLVNQMGVLSSDMREVRDKVIQFEAAKLEVQINQLRSDQLSLAARITTLELAKASATGARTLAQEVRDWMPYVFGLLGLAVFYFSQHPIG
ncbi:MAG: hypothetical protein QM647_15000 [Asticcacaulis sp.]|uniref:hypothetical protein n=1 Tax=Asticcacaulis sp. TaxID=1872648 RepID=UPI0039E64F82